MKMAAAGFAEKLVLIYQTTQHCTSADINLQSQPRENVIGFVSFENPHVHQNKEACGV
jgi:hypothetical protein